MTPRLPRPRLLVGAIALVLGGVAGDAAAQAPDTLRADTVRADTTAPARPDYALRGIAVTVPTTVATIGGVSSVVVRLDSMAHLPAPTLEQVLRRMPLVQIRRNSRGQAQPALRGAEDRQIAVLLDGVPLTLGWDHRTDLSVVPLLAARAVTLVRGLSSVLHGPNVLGGVVEIDVAAGPGAQTAPEPLSLSASVEHTGARALAVTGGDRLAAGGGDVVVRAGGGWTDTPGAALPGGLGDDGLRRALLTADGDLRLNSDERRVDGFLSGRWLGGGGAWGSLSASAYDAERGVPPETHVEDPRLWRYPDERRLVAALSGGTGMRPTAWGEGDVEASVGVDLASTEIDSYTSPAFDERSSGERSEDRTVTLRLLADHTAGSAVDLRSALTWADVYHREIEGGDAGRYRQRLWSAGAEAAWRAGPRTSVSAGAALDGAETPLSGDKPALGRLWDWGGRVGVSHALGERPVRLHGAVSRRARFPALRELYSGALGRFVPNPSLRSEVLRALEAGVTVGADGRELQAVAFHQRLEDGIVRTSVVVDGDPKFQRVNRDEVRSTGLELLGSASRGRASLHGDVTLQRVRGYTEEGEVVELEYEPAVAGRIGIDAALPRELAGSVDLRYRSDQLCQNPEVGGLEAFGTDPSVDLGLRRIFAWTGGGLSRLEAALQLDNAGDAAVYDQCGLPRPGRTLRLQLRLW